MLSSATFLAPRPGSAAAKRAGGGLRAGVPPGPAPFSRCVVAVAVFFFVGGLMASHPCLLPPDLELRLGALRLSRQLRRDKRVRMKEEEEDEEAEGREVGADRVTAATEVLPCEAPPLRPKFMIL
mmetsp:Transcript_76054/g.165987  ORF Transcript_76054/g.165987 Transcript_76054/m.165987 type:complete len:125 (-) Transcript_76054:1695-2069(-)